MECTGSPPFTNTGRCPERITISEFRRFPAQPKRLEALERWERMTRVEIVELAYAGPVAVFDPDGWSTLVASITERELQSGRFNKFKLSFYSHNHRIKTVYFN